MRTHILSAIALMILAGPALAQGDAAKGEKEFGKCKACHAIVADDGTVIMKGTKTGPNLYGVMGRQAGTVEGFKYGPGLKEAGEMGLVWTTETLVKYVEDPSKFIKEFTNDDKAKSAMAFKLKKGVEDIAAYLESVGPAPDGASAPADAPAAAEETAAE